MTDRVREAIRAIVALVDDVSVQGCWSGMTIEQDLAITALRARLAEPEPEPVAWIQPDHLQKARRAPFLCRVEPTKRMVDFVPLYTAPPTRRPLTEEEIAAMWRVACEKHSRGTTGELVRAFARAIERAHGIRGNNE